MAQHYIYQPLEEDQIRLLHLSLDDNEPHGIALSLCHVTLGNSKSEYIALSYTWDRPEPLDHDPTFQPDKIWRLNCNGGFIEVRQNLFDFLQQVRRAGSNKSTFWIDAICINQKDNKEKSEQVLRMGQIYAASSQVWIWLGSRPISTEAQQILEEFIPALLEDCQNRKYDYRFYRSIDILDEKSSNVIIQAIGYEKWAMWKNTNKKYWALFHRNWFARGWTVQETALQASKYCYVLVGSCVIPWEVFLNFSKFLGLAHWQGGMEWAVGFAYTWRRLNANRLFGMVNFPQVHISLDAITSKQKWYMKSLAMIESMREMSVKDPRDTIYAYLGIILQNKPPSVENTIVPDYTVNVELLYRNFATVMLQNIPNLRVLALVRHSQGRGYSMLPSWVPDFSDLPITTPYLDYDTSKMRHQSMNKPEISGNCLILRGAQFAAICSDDQSDEKSADSLHQLITYSFLSGGRADSGYCAREAVWRGVMEHKWRAPESLGKPLKPRIRLWLLRRTWDLYHRGALQESLSVLLARVADYHNLKEWLPTLEEVMRPDKPSQDEEVENLVNQGFIGRRLYYMTSGRIGIGPASLRSGDQVWIFESGQVPFVLRQNDDGETHTLLGTTYVHGIMYGEAITDEFRSSFRPVTLV